MPDLPLLIAGGAILCAVAYYLSQLKKDPVRQIDHPYFSRVWLWPPGSHARWEAELDVETAGVDKTVGFHSETTHEEFEGEEPTEAEVAFCQARLADLDGLFELSRPAVEKGWNEWVKKDMPRDWREFLSLDGFSVPNNGELRQPWGVTYFCKPAGHYLSIEFREGKPSLESVDG